MNHTSTAAAPARPIHHASLADYLELSKPGITLFITFTTATGYYLAPGPLEPLVFLHTVLGTSFTAAGAAALNQYFERDIDARMPRTSHRPIPSGHIGATKALRFALVLAALGLAQLIFLAPPIAALLAVLALLSYVWAYTPLKKRTGLCTFVGTLPGALPILAGYAARAGIRDAGGWILFAILALWQLPHFLSLAWLFRAQYANAGLQIMSVGEHGARRVANVTGMSAGLLIVASVAPVMFGLAGPIYGVIAVGLSLFMLRLALQLRSDTLRDEAARQLFALSLVYLPALLAMMMLDHIV
ncbi:MAG TPA: heme o synthase [Longimicrobiales bacterium]